MNRHSARSALEVLGAIVVTVLAVLQWGWATGLAASVAALFVYGAVSVLFKFKHVKKMAVSGASRMASD